MVQDTLFWWQEMFNDDIKNGKIIELFMIFAVFDEQFWVDLRDMCVCVLALW